MALLKDYGEILHTCANHLSWCCKPALHSSTVDWTQMLWEKKSQTWRQEILKKHKHFRIKTFWVLAQYSLKDKEIKIAKDKEGGDTQLSITCWDTFKIQFTTPTSILKEKKKKIKFVKSYKGPPMFKLTQIRLTLAKQQTFSSCLHDCILLLSRVKRLGSNFDWWGKG